MVGRFWVGLFLIFLSVPVHLHAVETHSADETETSDEDSEEEFLGFETEHLREVNEVEYMNKTNNYPEAVDYCWVRAQKMSNRLIHLANEYEVDPAGADGRWGTKDDLIKKIIIRYPSDHKWWYHIAATARNEEGKMMVCDPIDGALDPQTPREWAEYHGDGYTIEKGPIDETPEHGKVAYKIVPMLQYNPDRRFDNVTAMNRQLERDKRQLLDYIVNEELAGKPPYPRGSVIPDDESTVRVVAESSGD